MDQIKIGKFIAERRRNANLTQMQLAEKLNITDRAISKWENGKSMPDSSIMLELCSVLNISVNDLLNGEVITMDDYKEKTEQLLLDMAKQKVEADKKLLSLEILIGTFSIIILLSFTFAASFFQMANWIRICLIIAGFVPAMIGIGYALKIEQIAGYYECRECHHKYVPDYKSVFWAPHYCRSRYMKCPACGKKSYQKKVLTKD